MISLAVLLYQLFFVGVMYAASRLGRTASLIALAACLLWTATHLFFPPLAVLQTCVIVVSYFAFRRKPQRP